MMRFGRFLLVLAVALGSLTVCPAGRCALLGSPAAHDCCKKREGLTAPGCCPESGDRATPRLGASGTRDAASTQLAAAWGVVAWLEPELDIAARTPSAVAVEHGPAPPGTLVARETSLLL